MGLFTTKKSQKRSNYFGEPLSPTAVQPIRNTNDEIVLSKNAPLTDAVLDYLVGLTKADYENVLRVAEIYRKAAADAAKVLGKSGLKAKTILDEPDLAYSPYLDDNDLMRNKKVAKRKINTPKSQNVASKVKPKKAK